MKKTISIVLAAVLMMTVFTGCVSKEKQAAIDEYTKAVDTLNEKTRNSILLWQKRMN